MLHFFKNSRHLSGFDYNETTGDVKITFANGQKYTRAGVPEEAVKNWMVYRSPGEFYHQVIKRYPLVKENPNGAS